MRRGKDTKNQANQLIESMRSAGVKEFHVDIFGLKARDEIQDMVRYAKSLHKIAEHDCNGTMTTRMERQSENTEHKIQVIAKKYGLRATFDGDPRGYVVKLHSPKSDVYNTWGGAESGYGIG
jgi:hypothetical protein